MSKKNEERMYWASLLGLSDAVNTSYRKGRNLHYRIGIQLNEIRDGLINLKTNGDQQQLAYNLIPKLEFTIPKGSSGEFTVDPQSAYILIQQVKRFFHSDGELEGISVSPDVGPNSLKETPPPASSKRVFVVHGHDELMKQTVARYLERIGLEPIILHEQVSASRTIIEKFEHFSDVGFAVVLLSPDDSVYQERHSSSTTEVTHTFEGELCLRARQNVILELGYFIGKLGRSSVAALKKDRVEIPSDYVGVLYIPFDESGSWKISLAREMNEAGLELDFKKIVNA